MQEQLRFVDLFAGLGGFHLALQRLGHRCVFASELDPKLRALYKDNFKMEAHGDITVIEASDVPEHDLLCAGFPCQSFSKAGVQGGLDDPRGDLFFHVLRIVREHRPRLLLLENVPNLERHNGGQTWEHFHTLLKELGYDIRVKRLSPHRFGIPQIRERMFIVGSLDSLVGFQWPEESQETTSISTVLETNPSGARTLSPAVQDAIGVWQSFLDRFPPDEPLPSFPIWGMEFGATYPFEEATPTAIGPEQLRTYRGAHGQPLSEFDSDGLMAALPSYARTSAERFPDWKIRFIRQNRALYEKHRGWIDDWRSELLRFPPSYQKFEWNAKGENRNLSQLVLQFRASGVRAKRTTTAPSLVAMTTTQVPIITWENRYMTPHESARLQSMEELTLPDSQTAAFAALGNAVNVRVVQLAAEALLAHVPDTNSHPTASIRQAAMSEGLVALSQTDERSCVSAT